MHHIICRGFVFSSLDGRRRTKKRDFAHLIVEGPDGGPVVGALTEALGATVRHVHLEHHHFRAVAVALPALHPRVAVKPVRVKQVKHRRQQPRLVSFLSER